MSASPVPSHQLGFPRACPRRCCRNVCRHAAHIVLRHLAAIIKGDDIERPGELQMLCFAVLSFWMDTWTWVS